MPKEIWMVVHPNGARSALREAKTKQDAVRMMLNAFGLHALVRGMRLEYGPEELLNVGLCDFCCAAPYSWRYPCISHVQGMPGTGALGDRVAVASDDDWMACTECHDVYEGGGCEALIKRAVQSLKKQHPELTERMLLDRIRPAYEQFELMRSGQAIAVNKE